MKNFFIAFRVNWEEQHGGREVSTDENLTIWHGEWWTTERHVYLYSGLIVSLLFFMVSRSFAFYRFLMKTQLEGY